MAKTDKVNEQEQWKLDASVLLTRFQGLISDVRWTERMAQAGRILYGARSVYEISYYWGGLQIHFNQLLVWLLQRSGMDASTLCDNTVANMQAVVQRMGATSESMARCVVSGKFNKYKSDDPLLLFNDKTLVVQSVCPGSDIYQKLMAIMQLGYAFDDKTLECLAEYHNTWSKRENAAK